MKITKKLRDITYEELTNYCKGKIICPECFLRNVRCATSNDCWVINKDMYSDKFLDQTIEVEAPDILNKEEKEYLSYVIRPFRDKVVHIIKQAYVTSKRKYIKIEYREDKIDAIFFSLCFPDLPNDEMYKGMEDNRPYTLEELGL